MNVKTLSIPLFLILFCCILGCRNKHHNKMDETARDLPQIKDSGELVVLTLYSSTSYFIYGDKKWGSNMNLVNSLPKAWD